MSDELINWDLLTELSTKAHPLITIWPNFEAQIREMNLAWVAEVFTEARTAHHLLDMAEIPPGRGYSSHLDARTWLAVEKLIESDVRLGMIADFHHREEGTGGLVGVNCTECDQPWPCATYKIATTVMSNLLEGE